MIPTSARVLIAGGGGFIGGALAKELSQRGVSDLRIVDIAPQHKWFSVVADAQNHIGDLRDPLVARNSVADRTHVFNLAADMGGMGFIESHKADCMVSVLINTNLLRSCVDADVSKFFFSSSACVYSALKQSHPSVEPLREEDAYPAMPEDGYGWEKLFSERMCRHFHEDFGLDVRIARYHNVYGPHGTYEGGREKAPAALARKVAEAVLSGRKDIEIWGDGKQTRSFMYVEDCVEGTLRLMSSAFSEPINIGSSEVVTIDGLVTLLEDIAGISLVRRYRPSAPQGVRGRSSDNTLIRSVLDWEPSTSLRVGMEKTYSWIMAQLRARS